VVSEAESVVAWEIRVVEEEDKETPPRDAGSGVVLVRACPEEKKKKYSESEENEFE
jgi:hypothetical protein